MDDKLIAIIGAGPAGLSAAHELVRRDLTPVVFEKTGKIGGLARTESYKGFYFDVGGHRFFTKNQSIHRLWEGVLGEDFLKVPRMSRICYRGRFFNYPLEPVNALANLGLYDSCKIAWSYVKAQLKPFPKEDTFEQWVVNRFGRNLFETFFKTYTEKVWGIPTNEIQADWAVQRIKGLSVLSAVSNALLGNQNSKSLISTFYYPVNGPGMMWQRMAEVVEAGGASIDLNSEIIAVKHHDNIINSIVSMGNSGLTETPIKHLISSMPITDLVGFFDPKPPDAVLLAANQLSYRGFLTVGLIVNRPQLFRDQWMYIHDPDVKVGRIQNFKNWSQAMVPDPAVTSLGMEYFCNEGDAIWQMSDRALMEMGAAELAKLGLGNGEDILDGFVIREPKAYPIYSFGYDKHVKVIQDFLAVFKNLQTIGRNGMYRYNNMDHSMLTGILSVENLFGRTHDLWQVNEERQYLEHDPGVAADQSQNDQAILQVFAKVDEVALAAAVGVVVGLFAFLATLWLVVKGGSPVGPHLKLLNQYFIDYTVSLKGAFIAFGYSFSWGFLGGWLFAYLRNFFLAIFVYRVRKKAELLSLRDFLERL